MRTQKQKSERLKILEKLQKIANKSGDEGFLASKIACKILTNIELEDDEADYVVELMLNA